MSYKQQITSTACELIKFPTIDQNKQATKECLDWIKRLLEGKQLTCREFTYNGVTSLLITGKKINKMDLLLHGHLDVVPGDKEQFEPHITGDKLYGRGSCDMKGSLAVLLVLAQNYLADSNHGLLISTDEEIGGKNGCGYLVESGLINCNYFLTGEPTNLIVAEEEKGVIWFQLMIKGKSTHASTPWLGDNPLLKINQLINTIYRYYPPSKKEDWQTTIVPTQIKMDNSQNQVPQIIWIKFDCRYIPNDPPQKIIGLLSKLSADIKIDLVEPPLIKLEHPYTTRLEQLVKKLPTKMHFASDARFFSNKGIPSTIFGPVGGNIHGKNEWVSIDSLTEYYIFLKQFITET